MRLLIVFNPQPQAESIDTKWADSGAAFARRRRDVPTERVKQLGAALVEVAKPPDVEEPFVAALRGSSRATRRAGSGPAHVASR